MMNARIQDLVTKGKLSPRAGAELLMLQRILREDRAQTGRRFGRTLMYLGAAVGFILMPFIARESR